MGERKEREEDSMNCMEERREGELHNWNSLNKVGTNTVQVYPCSTTLTLLSSPLSVGTSRSLTLTNLRNDSHQSVDYNCV